MSANIRTASDEAAVLARFVSNSRIQRPDAWAHVENLKAVCLAAIDAELGLRAMRQTVESLLAESLLAESKGTLR